MGCIEDLTYDVIAKNLSFAESRKLIENRCDETHQIEPGSKLFGEPIIGPPPIVIGIDGDAVFFPYVKPCHGTFLLRISDPEEVSRIREKVRSKILSKRR